MTSDPQKMISVETLTAGISLGKALAASLRDALRAAKDLPDPHGAKCVKFIKQARKSRALPVTLDALREASSELTTIASVVPAEKLTVLRGHIIAAEQAATDFCTLLENPEWQLLAK